jgi:hypothetical protein
MKANLTETSENCYKAKKKSNKYSKQLPLLITIIMIISLMVFIPILFIGKNEKKQNILLKRNSIQSFRNLYTLNSFIKNNIKEENDDKNECISYDEDKNKC